ncbi:MAG: ATP-binding protein [Pseudomonadota bacterium]
MPPHTPNNQRISLSNVKRLFMLRNVTLLALLAAMLVVQTMLEIPLPWLLIAFPLLILALINLHTWRRLLTAQELSRAEFFTQIILDTLCLTALLYFTGGSTNPFVVLLMLPLIITAAALDERYTWTMAALTVGSYSLLSMFYWPLQFHAHHHDAEFSLHLTGMWIGFVFSALVVAFFVVRISGSLRQRDQQLALAREQALRDERLVALGTLAAGTAHELGTPLSTIAILSKELEHEYQHDTALTENLRLLRQQVDRCRVTLNTLSASAGELRAESGRLQGVDQFLDEVVRQWQAMRPGIGVDYRAEGPRPAPRIIAEHTLSQAIINILNNAADASPDNVEINGRWTPVALMLEVSDRGHGLSPEIAAVAGHSFVSTKGSQGLGLGLFIAHAVINRLGGEVRLYNREGGGVCASLILPLTAINETTK